MTFLELQNRVMRMLDETATGSPTTLVLVKDFLNEAHTRRCTEFPWRWMVWPREETITTVLGQRVYALHQEFHRPLYFRSRKTRNYLTELPQREAMDPTEDFYLVDPRDAEKFVFWGQWPVMAQPAEGTPSTVTVVSSSVSDTSALSVRISGTNASGVFVTENRTLNGTTPVVTSTSFTVITEISKSADTAGTLTFTLTASSTQILSLAPGEFSKQYRTIFLIDPPFGGEIIGYRFLRKPRELVYDYDTPLIPSPHDQILVYDALLRAAAYLTESNPQTVSLFHEQLQRAELALWQAESDGQSANAQSQGVRVVDGIWGL